MTTPNQTYSPVLGRRADGRVYVWRERGNIAHLTALSILSLPAWTACNRSIPRHWRMRTEGVLRPLCRLCARVVSTDNEV